MPQPKAEQRSPPVARPARGRAWLLFVHQLPAHPSNLRVRTWRRLQQLGALPIKQAVYVLPDTAAGREDFEWLKTEVKSAGGDASVFAADHVDAPSDDVLIEEFRRARQNAYAALARDVELILKRAAKPKRSTRAPAFKRVVEIFRERLKAIEGVDFFGSAGRDRVRNLLTQLEERTSDARAPSRSPTTAGVIDAASFHQRLWVTRPRPGVDRMASAWLIQRFIDAEARFGFAVDREAVPPGSVPFDMFGAEFGHRGDDCSFETLCRAFAIERPAIARISAIVHDLDLKDERFGAQECPTVGALIEGLQLAYADDHALLAQGITLFESLYRSFERSARPAGPRRVVKAPKT